jgi:hypothetical protein
LNTTLPLVSPQFQALAQLWPHAAQGQQKR